MRSDLIPTEDGQLATYRVGRGPALVMLHGGPGDTHHYLREVAEKLAAEFTCVLYDQRGTGASTLRMKTAETLALPKFFRDLERIVAHFDLEEPRLFGHSWGANLGLFFNLYRPELFARSALVSMGPLTDEIGAKLYARLRATLTPAEFERWQSLHAERREALALPKLDAIPAIDRELMRLRVKGWVFHPELRESYLEAYFREPPTDRLVNKLVWESAFPYFAPEKLVRVRHPLWFCTGHNDVMPPEQSIELAGTVAGAQICVLSQCGHIPWLDQPETFYRDLKTFLR